MRWLHLAILGGLVLMHTGCSSRMKSQKATGSRAGQSSSVQQSPTYPWKRPPEDSPRPQLPPSQPGKRDPF